MGHGSWPVAIGYSCGVVRLKDWRDAGSIDLRGPMPCNATPIPAVACVFIARVGVTLCMEIADLACNNAGAIKHTY